MYLTLKQNTLKQFWKSGSVDGLRSQNQNQSCQNQNQATIRNSLKSCEIEYQSGAINLWEWSRECDIWSIKL